MLASLDLDELSLKFEDAPATDIVAWAVETFGDRLCLTASMADAVLIDVATSVAPDIEIVFIDTDYHFPETLATVEAVRKRYNPRLTIMSAGAPRDDLWQLDTETCCEIRKVRPLEAAVTGKDAWLSGLRRADSDDRAFAPIVSIDKRGKVKVNPIANWSDEQVERYIAERNVPVNPLIAQGFTSVGCWPCTRAVQPGEDKRAGRWAGLGKTECGLHL